MKGLALLVLVVLTSLLSLAKGQPGRIAGDLRAFRRIRRRPGPEIWAALTS